VCPQPRATLVMWLLWSPCAATRLSVRPGGDCVAAAELARLVASMKGWMEVATHHDVVALEYAAMEPVRRQCAPGPCKTSRVRRWLLRT
jgi:hypothetical protein